MWFIGVEEEQETSAPPPKKIPGSALALSNANSIWNARTRFNEFIRTPKCFVGKQKTNKHETNKLQCLFIEVSLIYWPGWYFMYFYKSALYLHFRIC